MANHKSSLKRIRQTETRRLHNRYYAKTMRNAVRKLRAMTDKAEATAFLPKVQTMLDKLAKNNIIHKNKAANIKSSVTLHVNSLGWSLSARKHIAELRKEVRFFIFIDLPCARLKQIPSNARRRCSNILVMGVSTGKFEEYFPLSYFATDVPTPHLCL